MQAMRVELAKVTDCVIGDKTDPRNPRPGIMDFLQTHKDDLYGNSERQHVGVKSVVDDHGKRISILEDDKKKIYWTSFGISASVPIAWAAVKYWFKIP